MLRNEDCIVLKRPTYIFVDGGNSLDYWRTHLLAQQPYGKSIRYCRDSSAEHFKASGQYDTCDGGQALGADSLGCHFWNDFTGCCGNMLDRNLPQSRRIGSLSKPVSTVVLRSRHYSSVKCVADRGDHANDKRSGGN